MTNEELDKARAAHAFDQSGANDLLPDIAAHAARLAREGWTPPKVVDPDIAEANVVVNTMRPNFDLMFLGDAYRIGLAALKRGREIERAEAEPGMVWVKHDGSEKCPVDPTDAVMVQYGGGTCSYKVMAHLIHDWENVTHYAIITPPAEDVA